MDTGRPYSRLLSRLEQLNSLSPADRQRIAELPLKVVNYSADRELVSYGYSTSRCTVVLDGFRPDPQRPSNFGPANCVERQSTLLQAVKFRQHLITVVHPIDYIGPEIELFEQVIDEASPRRQPTAIETPAPANRIA